jgi:hypothetical protein
MDVLDPTESGEDGDAEERIAVSVAYFADPYGFVHVSGSIAATADVTVRDFDHVVPGVTGVSLDGAATILVYRDEQGNFIVEHLAQTDVRLDKPGVKNYGILQFPVYRVHGGHSSVYIVFNHTVLRCAWYHADGSIEEQCL